MKMPAESSPGLSVAALSFVASTVVVGLAVVVILAAGVFVSVETESGTLSGPASIVNDSGASGGKAVSFGTPLMPTLGLYVNPNTDAASQAKAWASSDPAGAQEMLKIAGQPTAVWFGDWNANVQSSVTATVNAAVAANGIPVLVAYNIPDRDCGGFSAGGSTDANYPAWISAFAAGIGGNPAIVILEPDALAGTSCLSAAEYQTRMTLLSNAVSTLKAHAKTKVYIDAGNPGWLAASDAASRLSQANIGGADGFSLNVSNFFTTAQNITYGQQVAGLAGGKHFIIDTSRNGLGSDGQWCNPPGRALGDKPTLSPGVSLVDAYLWVKPPGASDGTCNGGPAAGIWWPSYALGLAQNAAY